MLKSTLKHIVEGLPPGLQRPVLSLRDQLRLSKYRGDGRECPVCNIHLSRFAPGGATFPVLTEKNVVGGGYRDEAFCPACWANDRERLLFQFLQSTPHLTPKQGVVLHIAAESVLRSFFSARADLTYITGDLMRTGMDVTLNIQHIPLPDNSVDLVVCNHVLEHVDDDHAALAEFYRVMKPGARAILQVPVALALDETYENWAITDPHERELAFGQDDHVRLYGADYPDRLTQAGFQLDQISWRERPELFGDNAERFGFHPDEKIFLATKR